MIYTASFFRPEHHVGLVVSIARSQPRGRNYEEADALFPTAQLLRDYKLELISWYDYAEQYWSRLVEQEANHAMVQLDRLARREDDFTLCCWEHRPEHCHRSLAARFISERLGREVTVR